MDEAREKLRLVFAPLVAVSSGLIIIYTFLNWLLIIRADVIPIKLEVVEVFLPLGLPLIAIYIWIRPRVHLFSFKGEASQKNRKRFGYYFLSWVAITAPLYAAQKYIAAATGELTQLDSVQEIDRHPKTKYYTLKRCYIEKAHPGIYPTSKTVGRYGERLEFLLYVVCPVFGGDADTLAFNTVNDTLRVDSNDNPPNRTTRTEGGRTDLSHGVRVWIGTRFTEEISNGVSDAEKERRYRVFSSVSHLRFLAMELNEYQYLERLGNNEDRDRYLIATNSARNRPPSTEQPVILVLRNEPFERRTESMLGWTLGSFIIGLGSWLCMSLVPKLDRNAVGRFLSDGNILVAGSNDIGLWLLPRPGFFVTPTLIYLNLFVFLAMVLAGLGFLDFTLDDLLHWGANFRPLVLTGEWWRLVTSTFLHGGLMHLLVNMYSLLFVGIFLEPKLGARRLAAVYLTSAILGGITSAWWYPDTVSVGASGAIMGLYGALLALILTRRSTVRTDRRLLVSMGVFVVFNILFGFIAPVGIDNAAHLGGLAGGALMGLLLTPSIEGPNE